MSSESETLKAKRADHTNTTSVDLHDALAEVSPAHPWLARVKSAYGSRLGVWAVGVTSFVEALLPLPIITDPFLVGAIMLNRQNTVYLVLVTAASSVLGGVVAFFLASWFFDVLFALMTDGMRTEFTSLVSFGGSDTFLATLVGAVTPIPYTIVAWVIAVAGGSVWVFIAASIIGRLFRYTLVGYAAYMIGPRALQYARRSVLATTLFIALLVAIYVYLKF